jgi:hypothetical protein
VAERVVHGLEAVEVDEQDGADAARALSVGDRLAQAILEQQAVGQKGEAVLQRHALELLVRLLEGRGHARRARGHAGVVEGEHQRDAQDDEGEGGDGARHPRVVDARSRQAHRVVGEARRGHAV